MRLTVDKIPSKLGRRIDLRTIDQLELPDIQVTELGSFLVCAKLTVLDLSDNRISHFRQLQGLFDAPRLKSLFLLGNPVCRQAHYRDYCVSHCPSLQVLDGDPVTPQEKRAALEKFPECVGIHNAFHEDDPESDAITKEPERRGNITHIRLGEDTLFSSPTKSSNSLFGEDPLSQAMFGGSATSSSSSNPLATSTTSTSTSSPSTPKLPPRPSKSTTSPSPSSPSPSSSTATSIAEAKKHKTINPFDDLFSTESGNTDGGGVEEDLTPPEINPEVEAAKAAEEAALAEKERLAAAETREKEKAEKEKARFKKEREEQLRIQAEREEREFMKERERERKRAREEEKAREEAIRLKMEAQEKANAVATQKEREAAALRERQLQQQLEDERKAVANREREVEERLRAERESMKRRAAEAERLLQQEREEAALRLKRAEEEKLRAWEAREREREELAKRERLLLREKQEAEVRATRARLGLGGGGGGGGGAFVSASSSSGSRIEATPSLIASFIASKLSSSGSSSNFLPPFLLYEIRGSGSGSSWILIEPTAHRASVISFESAISYRSSGGCTTLSSELPIAEKLLVGVLDVSMASMFGELEGDSSIANALLSIMKTGGGGWMEWDEFRKKSFGGQQSVEDEEVREALAIAEREKVLEIEGRRKAEQNAQREREIRQREREREYAAQLELERQRAEERQKREEAEKLLALQRDRDRERQEELEREREKFALEAQRAERASERARLFEEEAKELERQKRALEADQAKRAAAIQQQQQQTTTTTTTPDHHLSDIMASPASRAAARSTTPAHSWTLEQHQEIERKAPPIKQAFLYLQSSALTSLPLGGSGGERTSAFALTFSPTDLSLPTIAVVLNEGFCDDQPQTPRGSMEANVRIVPWSSVPASSIPLICSVSGPWGSISKLVTGGIDVWGNRLELDTSMGSMGCGVKVDDRSGFSRFAACFDCSAKGFELFCVRAAADYKPPIAQSVRAVDAIKASLLYLKSVGYKCKWTGSFQIGLTSIADDMDDMKITVSVRENELGQMQVLLLEGWPLNGTEKVSGTMNIRLKFFLQLLAGDLLFSEVIAMSISGRENVLIDNIDALLGFARTFRFCRKQFPRLMVQDEPQTGVEKHMATRFEREEGDRQKAQQNIAAAVSAAALKSKTGAGGKTLSPSSSKTVQKPLSAAPKPKPKPKPTSTPKPFPQQQQQQQPMTQKAPNRAQQPPKKPTPTPTPSKVQSQPPMTSSSSNRPPSRPTPQLGKSRTPPQAQGQKREKLFDDDDISSLKVKKSPPVAVAVAVSASSSSRTKKSLFSDDSDSDDDDLFVGSSASVFTNFVEDDPRKPVRKFARVDASSKSNQSSKSGVETKPRPVVVSSSSSFSTTAPKRGGPPRSSGPPTAGPTRPTPTPTPTPTQASSRGGRGSGRGGPPRRATQTPQTSSSVSPPARPAPSSSSSGPPSRPIPTPAPAAAASRGGPPKRPTRMPRGGSGGGGGPPPMRTAPTPSSSSSGPPPVRSPPQPRGGRGGGEAPSVSSRGGGSSHGGGGVTRGRR